MVQLLNGLLTQCAGALMGMFQRLMPESNGWIIAMVVGLVLGMLPPLILLTLGFLLKAGRQGHLAGMADEARPIALRLTGWTALMFISVPFILTGETLGLPPGGVWYAAWLLFFSVGLGAVWLVLRLANQAQALFTSLTHRTESPYDDLLVELVVSIARGVLPIAIAAVVLHALMAHLGEGNALIGLAVVAAIMWSLLHLVAMLDRLLLARLNLNAADNLAARRMATQVMVIKKILYVLIVVLGLSAVLMQFAAVRQIGTSIVASVGLLSMIIGLAAQRTLGNVLAGIQIALTQPIRLDDVVVIEGEWGRIEEITLTYVVVRIWDQRRLIVPISQLIDKPFQNWTRSSAEILGTIFLRCDYRVPIDALRMELLRLVKDDHHWDRRVAEIQITEAGERSIEIRALVSSIDSGKCWDLRCAVREGLIKFMQQKYPESLPCIRIGSLPEVVPGRHQPASAG